MACAKLQKEPFAAVLRMKSNSDTDTLLGIIAREGTTLPYRKGHVLFSQGDPADAVFSIQKGKVKLTVISKHNKEAVIAILTTGDLVGEASLVGQLPYAWPPHPQ